MSCVCSRYYVSEGHSHKTEMKAYALNDRFYLQTIERREPGYTVSTHLEIDRCDAKNLMLQLQEFISQKETKHG